MSQQPRDFPPVGLMRERLVPISIATAVLMEFVDSTALSTALPTLARAFHADPITLKLALTSYLLTLAIVAPASGWIASRFGAKRVFLVAMTGFLLSSLLCAMSRSLDQLVAARLLQGAAGGLMAPVGRIIVVSLAPRERFVAAMSWFTMPALVGPLIGPSVAGSILSFASWPYIFLINIPIGLVGMIAIWRLVPRLEQADPGRFDTLGFCLAAVGITALVAVAELAGSGVLPTAVMALLAVTGAVAGGAFALHALRIPAPILALGLLRHRTVRISLLGISLARVGLGVVPLVLPLMLQLGLGWSPAKAGFFTLFQSIGVLLCKPVAPCLVRRFGFKVILLGSTLSVAAFTGTLASATFGSPDWLLALILAAAGFSQSLHFTAANTLVYVDVAGAEMGQTATLTTVVQQIGLSLGISCGALMLHLAGGEAAKGAIQIYLLPLVAAAGITALACPVYGLLPADAGDVMRGRK